MNAIIIDDHPLAIAAIRNLLIKNDIEILAELTEGEVPFSGWKHLNLISSSLMSISPELTVSGVRNAEEAPI